MPPMRSEMQRLLTLWNSLLSRSRLDFAPKADLATEPQAIQKTGSYFLA